MNSLMKNIKAEASKNPPLLYKKYITLPLFLSQDRWDICTLHSEKRIISELLICCRDEEMAKMTDGRVAMFSHDVVPHLVSIFSKCIIAQLPINFENINYS